MTDRDPLVHIVSLICRLCRMEITNTTSTLVQYTTFMDAGSLMAEHVGPCRREGF